MFEIFDSFSIRECIAVIGKQFSSIRRIFSLGQSAISSASDDIWFWFTFNSVTCRSFTALGIAVILFRDKSKISRCFRLQNIVGNSVIWLLLRCTCLRFRKFSSCLGMCTIMLLMALSVSSFTSKPSASGSSVSRLALTFKCFSSVKLPSASGMVENRFSDKSRVRRTLGKSRRWGGNSCKRCCVICRTPVFCAVSVSEKGGQIQK